MPKTTYGKAVRPLGHLIPGLGDDENLAGPSQFGNFAVVSALISPPLSVDGATYKVPIFIAPSDGCEIVDGWWTAAVAGAGGTNTLAIDNYDASANSARNVLSTTNIDPTSGITAKEGVQFTLSTTEANLKMDEGDVLNAVLVIGTQSVQGEGYAVTFVIFVPTPNHVG
jgi:hypothetical protein